jgi:RimJ/RimL family protein N-acetyltransferase
VDHELLTTARLTLRRPAPADLPAIFAVHADPAACRHNPSDALRTVAQARGLLARWDAQWRRSGFGYWVVRDPDGVVGFCGLKPVPMGGREVLNLFYRFAPFAWGRGYATEAATAVVSWASRHRTGWPVVARVRPANTASQRVALRAGLVRVPHLDDTGADGPDWLYASTGQPPTPRP